MRIIGVSEKALVTDVSMRFPVGNIVRVEVEFMLTKEQWEQIGRLNDEVKS